MVVYRIPSIIDVYIMPGEISNGYTHKQVDFYTSIRVKKRRKKKEFSWLHATRIRRRKKNTKMFSGYEIFLALLCSLARKIRTFSLAFIIIKK